jgi:hypothetical protein
VLATAAAVLAALVPAAPARAAVQATTWIGQGAVSPGDEYTWGDPENWNNGVPTAGAEVMIAPIVTTHIVDVDPVQVASLTLGGSGDVVYDLQASDPEGLSNFDVTTSFTWISGTLGAGLGVRIDDGAVGTIEGDPAAHDRAVLEGQISVGGDGVLRIERFGDGPVDPADATFAIGPDTFPGFGGTIQVDAIGGDEPGRIELEDGVTVVADQPGDPGSIGLGGTLVALGPEPGSGVTEPAGVRLIGLDIAMNIGELAATPYPDAPFGAAPGSLALDGCTVMLNWDATVRGPGPVVFGEASVLDNFGGNLVLADDAVVELGDEAAAAPATMTVDRVSDRVPGLDGGTFRWTNATIAGEATTLDTTVMIDDGDDPLDPIHALQGDLRLGADGGSTPFADVLATTVGLDPGVTFDVDTQARLSADGEAGLEGDATSELVVQGELRLAEGDHLSVDGPWVTNEGLVALGRGMISLEAASVFGQAPTGTLTTRIAGTVPGDGFGAIVGDGSATEVVAGGTFRATRVGGYRPGFGQIFDVIELPGGGLANLFGEVELPSVDWSLLAEGDRYRLTYLEPVADLVLTGTGPTKAQRGDLSTDVFTLENVGPRTAREVSLLIRIGDRLSLRSFAVVGGSCEVSDVLLCSFGRLGVDRTVRVTVYLRGDVRGWGAVHGRAAPMLFDPDDTTNRAAVRTRIV